MLSRNLQRKRALSKKEQKSKTVKSFVIVVVIAVPVTYGILNLSRLKANNAKKEELKVETGDRPIEKKVKIVINAEGGLNIRKDKDAKSDKIGKILNGTKLEALKELDGWYNIEYDGKNGWISKEFTTIEGEVKKDETSDWLGYAGDAYGFSVKYPRDWSAKDYGPITGSDVLGYVAFSFSELPTAAPQGVFVPIEIKLSSKPQAELEAPYKSMAQKTVSDIAIGSEKGVKYVYTDTTDNTEKTRIFFTHNGKTYSIGENGGYQEDLDRIMKTMVLK